MTKLNIPIVPRITSVGAVAIGAGVLVVGAAGNVVLGQTAEAATDGTVVVTEIVDGDTIKVDLGGVTETVRLIGIDTPEVDECGYRGGHRRPRRPPRRPQRHVDRRRPGRPGPLRPLLRYVNITEDGGTLAESGWR